MAITDLMKALDAMIAKAITGDAALKQLAASALGSGVGGANTNWLEELASAIKNLKTNKYMDPQSRFMSELQITRTEDALSQQFPGVNWEAFRKKIEDMVADSLNPSSPTVGGKPKPPATVSGRVIIGSGSATLTMNLSDFQKLLNIKPTATIDILSSTGQLPGH